MINIDDFAKVEMKVGTILEVEEIEGSEKLWKLKVDLGPSPEEPESNVIPSNIEKSLDEQLEPTEPSVSPQDDNESDLSDTPTSAAPSSGRDIRQVLSGIKQFYTKEELIGRQAVFVANLAPRQMMGLESQAMIMAAEGEDRPILLTPSEKVPNGSKIR